METGIVKPLDVWTDRVGGHVSVMGPVIDRVSSKRHLQTIDFDILYIFKSLCDYRFPKEPQVCQ